MLSSIDLYHSPTAASSRLAARSPPSASSMKVALPSPRPSSSKIVLAAPTRSTSQVRHSASPSPDSKTEVDSASSRGKGKRLRRAQACDICPLANKYNLLIYTLPLTPWDESRPSEATIPSQRGLSCTIPSWIQPAPSRKEAADILRALLEAGSDVESDVGFGVASWTAVPAVLSGSYASDGGGELWDDEEMAQRVRASRSSADDDSDRDSVGESVLAQKGMPIDMDVEENASLEREPESSSAPRGSSHLDCQFPLQHPEQQSMNSGIDPFLLTACHSFSTPPQASPETPWSSIKNSISERNGSCRKKEEDAFWQEGIPAVLQEASNPNALQESLQSLSE
ncbi:hypothetical protein NDA14_001414 [Ustilago hordei]|nr:hypothetical protein NDA10_002553 [Ustilago hordei]KAJ1599414.1 hypothetical protein NDA14_001414 [Ustilago hordei]